MNRLAKIKKCLDEVTKDKVAFDKSVRASFNQFDVDKNGLLNLEEIKCLLERLCVNLQLPSAPLESVEQIFKKFDVNNKGELDLDQFSTLYWQILNLIKHKYYPTTNVTVKRDYFIGRTTLTDDIRSKFKFGEKLGQGSFGKVHLATERFSGLERVCKSIEKKVVKYTMEQIEAEIEVMKKLDHPNIIKVFEVYEDEKYIYIIMETCHGGELGQRVHKANSKKKILSESYVAKLMRQLLAALTYFHGKNVAHKDLKPENILFQDRKYDSPIKVIDFGLAEMFRQTDDISTEACGTALFMAPEVFNRRVNLKCDVWGAGCIMFFMLCGQVPFFGTTFEEVKRKILYKEPDYRTHLRFVSEDCLDLLRKMLEKDPAKRVSSLQAMGHPWIRNAGEKRIVVLPNVMYNNLCLFMRHSTLKNAILYMMAHQLNIRGTQIERITEIFRAINRSGLGQLSYDELSEGLGAVGISQPDINRMYNSLDLSGEGYVSFTQFLAATYTWRESQINIMWSAFNKMDRDGDGKVTVEEFARVLSGVGPGAQLSRDDTLLNLIKQLDSDGNGVIVWDEFLEYMKSNV